ncbi:hypothetical protein Ancab_024010 [Ancistrocladus abbreviatus]
MSQRLNSSLLYLGSCFAITNAPRSKPFSSRVMKRKESENWLSVFFITRFQDDRAKTKWVRVFCCKAHGAIGINPSATVLSSIVDLDAWNQLRSLGRLASSSTTPSPAHFLPRKNLLSVKVPILIDYKFSSEIPPDFFSRDVVFAM